MIDAKELKKERTQIMYDIYDNKIPKRVPIIFNMGTEVTADLCGVNRIEAFWHPEILAEGLDKLYGELNPDVSMFWAGVYTPYSSQTLAARNRAMSSGGFMQHPNTVCMQPDEYDEFIKDPLAFVIETAMPRIYGNLDRSVNASRLPFAIYLDNMMTGGMNGKVFRMLSTLEEKYGYPDFEPNVGGMTRVPLDWLADQLRSFDGICVDIRRNKQKVIDAIDAAYPWLYKAGLPADPSCPNRHGVGSFQLHMATYLRAKDFEDVWFNPWKRQLNDYASLGMRNGAFLEENWTAKIDYLLDLPTGMAFDLEQGDPKLFKEKLGKKFILGGGFPVRNLIGMTKEEIVKATREWLDIMMPGGNFQFGFDKGVLVGADINMENLKAVFDTVREYGQYGEEAGKPAGEVFHKEDYKSSNPPELNSRAYITWEQYKELYPNTPESAKAAVMANENLILTKALAMSC